MCKVSLAAVIAVGLFVGTSLSPVRAADIATVPSEDSGWSFAIAPYLWAAGIDGTAGIFGFPPQDIDLSFGDVLSNLDLALMAVGEARNDRFSIGVDLAYVQLGTDVGTPFGILADEVEVTATTFMGTAVVGYSLLEAGASHLDIVAGARLWSVGNDFDFNGGALDGQSADDGATWVDPLVGAKFRADLGSNFYLNGWGLIGGFGVSSELMWDVMAGLGYDFNETFSMFGGYRALGVDYSNDGFVYDIVQQGPMFGGVIRF